MKSYFLSIISVVLISVLIELFMTSGSTKKFIQIIVNLGIIVAIVLPLVNLVNSGLKKGNIDIIDTEYEEASVDRVFLDYLSNKELETAKGNLTYELEAIGYKNPYIDVVVSCVNTSAKKIEYVNIYLDNSVIKDNEKNIYNNVKIVEIVKKYFSIEKSRIVIYE